MAGGAWEGKERVGERESAQSTISSFMHNLHKTMFLINSLTLYNINSRTVSAPNLSMMSYTNLPYIHIHIYGKGSPYLWLYPIVL